MIAAIVTSIMTALAAPDRHLVAAEGVLVHEDRGQPGRRARPAVGQRHDQVVGLDRHVREHDEGRQEDRPQQRDDDPAIDLRRRARRRSARP